MKTYDKTLSNYKNLNPVSSKGAFEFSESKLKERLKQFYKFEMDLTKLTLKEIHEWISMFKLNDTHTIEMRINIEKFRTEKGIAKMKPKTEALVVLFDCLRLAFCRSTEYKPKEYHVAYSGRIVSDAPEAPKKVSRKDQLKLI